MGKKRDKDGNVIDDQGNIIASREDDPPENDDPPVQGPTDEEILERFRRGDLLTKEHYSEKVEERLKRDREARRADEEKVRADAEEAARRKALKDQENYKELSESQATELANKDQEITTLKESNKRISALEDRLSNIVEAQTEGLAPAFKALLGKMTVEERAEWVEANPDLVNGSPEGSPPTPPGDRQQMDRNRKDEAAKRAREDQQRAQHSRI